MPNPLRHLITAALLLSGLMAEPAARADEFYFIIVFGSESKPRRARRAHTWATYVAATGEGKDLTNSVVTIRTNSWLPCSLKVRPLNPFPQRGVNLDLYSTMDYVLAHNEEVVEWGPYQFTKDMYDRGMTGIDLLESGQIKYRAMDGRSPQSNIKNCFHSISDIMDRQDGRDYYPMRSYGEDVSFRIVESLHERGKIVNQGQDHTWIDRRLGLDRYPIIHHPYSPATPPAVPPTPAPPPP